jgi:phosphoribosylaminoimidazole-succinocarboxamide synthase
MTNTITQIDLPGIKKLKSGKVREVFDLGDSLLFVATDRISAFDVILPNPIPEKGRVLTALSEFWFGKTGHIVENHLITSDLDARESRLPKSVIAAKADLQGRSMLVRKCQPLPVECVVRGYLAGSGLKEYKQSQTVCGIKLPDGLVESSPLPQPIFTPATKAETGHDENITVARMRAVLGDDVTSTLERMTRAVYALGEKVSRERGIIIADTKFEFGRDSSGRIILIDEVMTPDSSRFWAADAYRPGQPQPSFDKQPLRDYLDTERRAGRWNGEAPPPPLPAAVVDATSQRYLEAYRRVTGADLKIT